jgi:hypothetical protein
MYYIVFNVLNATFTLWLLNSFAVIQISSPMYVNEVHLYCWWLLYIVSVPSDGFGVFLFELDFVFF